MVRGVESMTEKTFNVRDFIMPPYKTCPECGQDMFGVLTIEGTQYSRRCQNCLHLVKIAFRSHHCARRLSTWINTLLAT